MRTLRLFASPQKFHDVFGLSNRLELTPRYNSAPTQSLPIVIRDRAGFARWGMAADNAGGTFNARSETVAEKAAFRASWQRGRRCLIPASGYYEWRDGKPHFVHRPEDCLALAGLWTKDKDGVRFTILTKRATGHLAQLHDRMPVHVPPREWESWYTGGVHEAERIIEMAPSDEFEFYAVTPKVGNVANDDASLVEPWYACEEPFKLVS